MKTLRRVCASTALALIMSATCFAQLRIAIRRSASANLIVAYPHASFTVSGSGPAPSEQNMPADQRFWGLKIIWTRLIRSIRTGNRTTIYPWLFPSATSEAS